MAGCSAPPVKTRAITVNISADGQTRSIQLDAGSTAQEAFASAGILVNSLDRSEPPLFTVLTDGAKVRLTRVTEEFSQPVEEVIPFEHQEVRSESLTNGQKLLSQKGINGLRQITFRRVYEEGVKVSEEQWEVIVIKEPVPEIMVVGVGQSFEPTTIPGRIAYLLGGNAWIMEGSTGVRRPVVKSGDLDGRIFSLSPDGHWLLFTRRSEKAGTINTLWMARMDENSPAEEATENEVDLQTANVIHFADWMPQVAEDTLLTYYTVAYSTVEPRPTAPGWQANNDLAVIGINPLTGYVSPPKVILESNSGGAYGWWGATFAWSPNGKRIAYANPDTVGLIELEKGTLTPYLEIVPLQTGSDWAWAPGIAWGPDNALLYTVDHIVEKGIELPDTSPQFELAVIPLSGGLPLRFGVQTGMFAYPVPSPLQSEHEYQVAYLQAIAPRESDSSLYRLAVMDRDGSNRRVLFPTAEERGLEPQRPIWSPQPVNEQGNYAILVIRQGNLWLVNPTTGEISPITGDGLTSRVDWK